MNTFLNEADKSIKVQFEAFAKEHLAPVAQALESRQADPRSFLQKAAQAGLLAVTVPEEFGGRGSPFLHAALMAEALGAIEPGIALTLAVQTAVIELIKRSGTDAQRGKYLSLLGQGELLGALAYFEDNASSGASKTTVSAQGAQILLSGQKNDVVNGRLAQVFVVFTESKDAGAGLWLVDAGSRQNMKIAEQGPRFGLRSAYLDQVAFDKFTLKADDRLGNEGASARSNLEFALSVGKTMIAASAVGLLEGLLVDAAKQMQSKELHGEPAGQSQALQWRLADLGVHADAGRLLTYRAALSKDEQEDEFTKNAAMCKSFAARAARVHSAEAIQILEVLSNPVDSRLERVYRDAKMFELCLGTNDDERVLLGRELGI